jgi:hypothetical protein
MWEIRSIPDRNTIITIGCSSCSTAKAIRVTALSVSKTSVCHSVPKRPGNGVTDASGFGSPAKLPGSRTRSCARGSHDAGWVAGAVGLAPDTLNSRRFFSISAGNKWSDTITPSMRSGGNVVHQLTTAVASPASDVMFQSACVLRSELR